MRSVRIIGGGFSGLTLGYYLTKFGVPVEIFEKTNRLGGLISTLQMSWGMVETAANGILSDERVVQLFEDLQITIAEPLKADRHSRARYIFRSRPRRWPLNILETLKFFCGLLRFFLYKKTMVRDEELKDWAIRLFGSAGFNYLIGPALQGVYGTTELSKMLIVRAVSSSWSKKKSGGTIAPLNGMQELIDGLARKIGDRGGVIHLQTAGEVQIAEGSLNVVATSARVAAQLLSEVAPSLAYKLNTISYLPIATVTIALSEEANRLSGFGCLFPKSEGFKSLGVLFNNSIFRNRSSRHSETWIFDTVNKDEKELLDDLQSDRKKIWGVSDEIKNFVVTAHPQALPHYNFSLQKFVQFFEEGDSSPQHIYLTGNYLGAIGLAKILAYNEKLAKKIANEISQKKINELKSINELKPTRTKRALLYINLGTPRSFATKDVARYLREFLMDSYVLDIPFFLRWFLVNILIVPFRSKKTSQAYKKIWGSEGSPLMVNSVQLVSKLAQHLQPEYRVELAMRYGNPSLKQKIKELLDGGYEDIKVLTAYPQYAQSSTETALNIVRLVAREYFKNDPAAMQKIKTIKSYESHFGFINAYAKKIADEAKKFNPDYYLFSYHGLPKRHLKKISPMCEGVDQCSFQDSETNRDCYRRQCYKTTEGIVKKLNLLPSQFTVGFQSRLTKGWIQPFSDEIYRSLPQKGFKRLLVACPSFTADCLETVEEIGLRAREEFLQLGGEDLRLVPSLNDDELWVAAIHNMLNDEQLWVEL